MAHDDEGSPFPAPVTAVVGNPKARSRTHDVAMACAGRIADALGAPVESVDLADLGPRLLGWGDEHVARALTLVRSSAVLVVASPVYKATYTGLLKLLLDQLPAGDLGGLPTVPLMVGGAASHAMAVDVHLRPVLIEVGCSCPTAGLFVLESELDDLDGVVGRWFDRWGASLLPLARARPTG